MMIIGGVVAVTLLPVGVIMDWDQSMALGAIGWGVVIFLALSFTMVGCLTLRFELTEPANQHMQPTPR